MHKLFEIPFITLFLYAFCAFLWLKNPFNQRNPRLMNYLHAFGIFTLVKRSLQIRLFMQNEPNFPDDQMNVNKVLTKDYENKSNWTLGENEPKTNPNEANFQKAKINVNFYSTKDYENKLNWALFENEPNTNPIQTQTKPISKAKNTAAYDTGDCHRKIFKKN